jgi:two-component system sensor histidine kinase CssS
MRNLKYKSLSMRIWSTFTAIILILICSVSLIYMVVYRSINEGNRIHDLKVAHDTLLKNNNFNQQIRFGELKGLKGIEHFTLKVNSDGSTKIGSLDGKNEPPPMAKGVLPPPNGNDIATKRWMTSFIKSGKVYDEQFKESYQNMSFIFIISLDKSDETGKTYLISYMPNMMQDNIILYTVIIIGIITSVVGFFTAKLVANYISKPLKELEEYTVRIAHKDWKEPIKVKSDDEIGRLVNSMNLMQKELKHADEEEKMFLQSISHDLKTPVMVIMSHADAIIDGVYIESVEKTAEIIREEAINLEKKIKQMLYLNTLDYVLMNNSEDIEINFQRMLLHIISRFEVINSKIEWDLDIDEINIIGNVDRIQVAIENILDNGLRYVEEKVSVTLKQENSFAVLEIYNDGPNIDDKHIGHIFDNLYKDKTGNFGLGLAISKKIIDFYKGEIEVVNRDKGVSFIIKYPI